MATHAEIHHCNAMLIAILEQGILNLLLPYDWLLDFNSGVRSVGRSGTFQSLHIMQFDANF